AVNGELEDHGVDFQLDPYTITKTSDGASETRAGKVVNYAIAVTTPLGDGASTTPQTITVRDDLAGVLDDATFLEDSPADNSNPHGEFKFDPGAKELSWTGPTPPPGQTTTLTYSVRIGGDGDRELDNAAWVNNPYIADKVACEITGSSGRDPETDEPCAVSGFDTPSLSLAKTSSHKATDRAGSVVTYTVTATNEGPGDYTLAQPAWVFDDLSGVTDDAAYLGDVRASRPGTLIDRTASQPLLGWSGPLPAGQSVTLTYSVRLRTVGDGLVRNTAWSPRDPAAEQVEAPTCAASPDTETGEICATHEFGRPRVNIAKSFTAPSDPPLPGQRLTYTVTAKNTGRTDFDQTKPLVIADDLTDVLDATKLDPDSLAAEVGGAPAAKPTFDPAASRLYWVGPLAAGQEVVITYQATVTGEGNGVLRNVAWVPRGQNPPTPDGAPLAAPTQCGDSGYDAFTEEPCAVSDERRPLLALGKSLATDPVLGPVPGSKVTYTVTGVNRGVEPYTDASPATVWDDLNNVLEGAALDQSSIRATVAGAEATPQPAFDQASGLLKWSGGLAPGESVVITYTVTLKPSGAPKLRNVAWVPRADPPVTPGCEQPAGEHDDPVTNEVCAAAELSRPLLEVKKQASGHQDARFGDTVHYTVTAKNTGQADFTASSPAQVRDTLADTVDDATAPKNLTASRTAPAAPQPPTWDQAAQLINWTGALPVGAEVKIEYDVTLRNGGDAGDQVVADVAWAPLSRTSTTAPACLDAPGGVDRATGEPCGRVSFGLPGLTIAKSWQVVDAQGDPAGATAPQVGDLVEFTIELSNTGQADYTSGRKAELVDSLAATLSQTELVKEPAVNPAPGPEATLIWENVAQFLTYRTALAQGESHTITYTVKLTSTGSGRIANTAFERSPGGQGVPTCQNQPDGVDAATGDACDRSEIAFPVARIAKTSDLTENIQPGDLITYTWTVTNVSQAPFTDSDPAHVFDELSQIVTPNYAEWAGAFSASSGAAQYTEQPTPMIRWSGALDPGETATVTYQLRYLQSSGSALVNIAWQPADPANPATPDCLNAAGGVDPVSGEPCSRVDSPLRTVELAKTAKFFGASGAEVANPAPGDRVAYTITAANTGGVDYTAQTPLVLYDDLASLLAAASFDPASAKASWAPADAALDSGAFQFDNGRLVWRGSLKAGQVLTLTYEAVLSAQGPASVSNVVWEPANPHVPDDPPTCDPSPGPQDATSEACAAASFDRPLLEVAKTATPSQTPLETGDTVDYTVTVTNRGAAAFTATAPAVLLDSLAKLRGSAELEGAPVVADPAGTAADLGAVDYDPTSMLLAWEGPLTVGESRVIT
ncbi:MAG: DUF11 domain-containing protein, partial [Bifidobacteriaceae bacterium]|nr:DUF11 domain-containing protein [Bifidobacteriaceae bacterium]